MRLLVDAQLPPALARWLVSQGHDATHVVDEGIESVDDRVVWDHAAATGAVIVTKDEDFAVRRELEESGPTIVWIRVGNTTKRDLLARFERLLPTVLDALQRGERLVEIT
jgi:predicted nuclease of predicted toxin-antitoxin system